MYKRQIVALTPVAVGIADKTGVELAYMVAIVVGGAFFGDNLSFISDTTIAATKTQGCEMRDKFKVNSLIVMPAAILLLFYYVFAGMHIHTPTQIEAVEWIKVIPYLCLLYTSVPYSFPVPELLLVPLSGNSRRSLLS